MSKQNLLNEKRAEEKIMLSTPTYHLVRRTDGRICAIGKADTDVARKSCEIECWGIDRQHVGSIYDALETLKRDLGDDRAVHSFFRRTGGDPRHSFTVYRNLDGLTFDAQQVEALVVHPATEEVGDITVEDVTVLFAHAVEALECFVLEDQQDDEDPITEHLVQEVIAAGLALESKLGCTDGRREAFDEIDRVISGTAFRRDGERLVLMRRGSRVA